MSGIEGFGANNHDALWPFYGPRPGKDKKTSSRDAAWRNYIELRNTYANLSNLYLNTFEWKGLPETVSERHMMRVLFEQGMALFFRDPDMGYMALECAGAGGMDVYYRYKRWRAIGNQYNREFDRDECVRIRQNFLDYPPVHVIRRAADKIADAHRTVEVFSSTMKRPWVMTGDFADKMTFKVAVDEVNQNEVLVAGNAKVSQELMKAYPNPLDGNGLMALWRHIHELQDEIYTWMGINNANTEKRERLITSEVESNNQLVNLSIDSCIDWLKRAANEINEMFGLSVSVDLKHDYLKEAMDIGQMDNGAPESGQGGGSNIPG